MSLFTKKDEYDVFWNWFNKREESIFNHLEEDTNAIALEISTNLKKIHNDLAFEISFEIINGKRNFVLSADGVVDQFPIIIELANRAPIYNRWNIIPFRPRLDQHNQVIEMEDIKLDYNDIFFQYVEDDKLDLIHLDVFVLGYDGQDNRYVHIYFILLDSLVGEYDAVTKIGDTIMYPLPEESDLVLHEFKDLIGILDGLDKTDKIN